ncbi:MAG: hypothetical protein R3260_05780 [Pseudomonas sp.]|nr:hypothetical protein [Pseudomonas sp.]
MTTAPIKTSALIALITITLSGCASDITTETIANKDYGTIIPGKILTSPIKRKAALGEEMLTAGEYSTTPTKKTIQIATMTTEATAHIKHKLKKIDFNLPPSNLKLEGSSNNYLFYKYPQPFLSRANVKSHGGLMVPKSSPRLATKIYWDWIPSSRVDTYYTASLSQPLAIDTTSIEQNISTGKHQTPQQVLIYSGVSGGQIRFVYKEFTRGGIAKPLFTQDVILDYVEGEEYAFKSARFTVNKAGPAFIEFTLIKPL